MTVAEPTAIGSYSASQVARLAGVSPRRIGSWARYGIVPSVSARPRVYSYADAGEAVLVHYLVDEGKPVKQIRMIIERLREEFGPWPLSTAPLAHDGRLVVVRRGDEVVFDAADDQEVIAGTLINLKAVSGALSRGGYVALQRSRPHIEVDPERLSGAPTVRGHRIPTAMVVRLAAEAGGRDRLREIYGLSDEEIEDALGYESAVDEALAA